MSASPAAVAAPQSPLLCDTCSCALIFAGTAALLVGRCAPCVKRVALAAKGITQPVAPAPLTWDYVARGNGCALIEAVSFDGTCVDRAEYTWSRAEGLGEVGGALPADARDELREALESGKHQYRGDLAKAYAAAIAAALAARAEPQGFRSGAAEALGLGLCACCGELAIDCRKAKAVSL